MGTVSAAIHSREATLLPTLQKHNPLPAKLKSLAPATDSWSKSTALSQSVLTKPLQAKEAAAATIPSYNLLKAEFSDAPLRLGEGLHYEMPLDRLSTAVQNDPLNQRGPVARLTTAKTDHHVGGGSRAQLVHHPVPMGEYTYKVGFLIPEKFHSDKSQDILAEWHNTPDLHEGEKYNLSPPLAFSVINNRFILERRWDANRITLKNPMEPVTTDLGPLEKGAWQDFQFHINWHWTDKGYTGVYQNGKKIHETQGPNAYNDSLAPYFKAGIYKWNWDKNAPKTRDADRRTVYVSHMSVDTNDTVEKAAKTKKANAFKSNG